MLKNKKSFKKINLRIFPKTFLSMSLILGVLIIIVHGLVYVLMSQTYAAEKQQLAKKNLEELTLKISGKEADVIRQSLQRSETLI